MSADDGWEARMSARSRRRDLARVRPTGTGPRPRSNGYEWVWICPYCTSPRWGTTSPTFVGAVEKGRRHLALLSWPTGELRYDNHPVCLDKMLTA